MRKITVLWLVFSLLFSQNILWAADKWNSLKSTHFIIYYDSAPEDFINTLSEKAEQYYNKIADNLGFTRFNFWLWDNRAKIYIHNDAQSYQGATGNPVWSGAGAIPSQKIIHTFPYESGFFEVILPHEMGHIIFREFVGFYNQSIPAWLDEGVASSQEASKSAMADTLVRQAIKQGNFLSLDKLASIKPNDLKDYESVGLFYAESISILDYLIKEFGKDKFVHFCQNLRDKKNLERSLALVYSFSNVKDLSHAWEEYLTK